MFVAGMSHEVVYGETSLSRSTGKTFLFFVTWKVTLSWDGSRPGLLQHRKFYGAIELTAFLPDLQGGRKAKLPTSFLEMLRPS